MRAEAIVDWCRTRLLMIGCLAICALALPTPILVLLIQPGFMQTPNARTFVLFAATLALSLGILGAAGCARLHVDALVRRAKLARRSGPRNPPCLGCGGAAGAVFCSSCGALEDQHAPAFTRLSVLISRRWHAIALFLVTAYIPGGYAVLREASLAVQRIEQSKHDATANLSSAWSELRGPLIAFGAECGPSAGRGEPLAAKCDELFTRMATVYAKVSWFIPAVLADLRVSGCSHPQGELMNMACEKLKADYPIERSSTAFHHFANAYAAYGRSRSSSSTPDPAQGALEDLACASQEFYTETRKLGCSLILAGLPELAAGAATIYPYCDSFLREGSKSQSPPSKGDAAPLCWMAMFGAEPEGSCNQESLRCHEGQGTSQRTALLPPP